VANISAPLLRERAAELSAAARRGGALILSGFLVEDVPGVSAEYETAGTLEAHEEGIWAALTVRIGR